MGDSRDVGLRNDLEPSRLRFDSADDAARFADQLVKDANRRFACKRLGLVEGYVKMEIEIVVQLRTALHGDEFELVFIAVPGGRVQDHCVAASDLHDSEHAEPNVNGGEDQHFVLASVAGVIQTPESDVPSLVRLELPHERKDFLRERLGPAP